MQSLRGEMIEAHVETHAVNQSTHMVLQGYKSYSMTAGLNE